MDTVELRFIACRHLQLVNGIADGKIGKVSFGKIAVVLVIGFKFIDNRSLGDGNRRKSPARSVVTLFLFLRNCSLREEPLF